jgi:hypothetical protein
MREFLGRKVLLRRQIVDYDQPSEPQADERERTRQNPAGQRQLTHKIYSLSSMVSIGQTMQKIDEMRGFDQAHSL